MPPNIIHIGSDQHRFDCLALNGHPLVQTPNLDRLAGAGINFTHAFTPSPVCVPARASMMTGQWPAEHGSIANPGTEAPWPFREGLPTFSEGLRRVGYYLGYVGEWHVSPVKTPLDYGFHEFTPLGEYRAWRQRQGIPDLVLKNRWFGECDPHIRPEQSRLAWGADHLLRMLRERAAAGGPFFLRWEPVEPHLPNLVPEPYCSMYRPEQLAPWPSFGDTFAGKPYIQAQQLRTWKLTDWTWADWAPVVARYLGEVTLLDAQVGRVLAALDELGLAHDTVVVYTTDHGDLCGGHRMIDKHFVMYEDVVHVPLMVRWPARIRAGRTCPAFVCNAVDLARTYCELAGAPVPETFRGQSLLSLFDGADDQGRTDIFACYHGSQFGLYSQRMVRDRRWKYIWNATAEDELYDLERDPAELRNVATAPEAASEAARLRQRLIAWMEQTHDPLLNGWTREQLAAGLTR